MSIESIEYLDGWLPSAGPRPPAPAPSARAIDLSFSTSFEDVANSRSFDCNSESDDEVYKKQPPASRTLKDSDSNEEVEYIDTRKAASKVAPAAAGPVIELDISDEDSGDVKRRSRTPPPPADAFAAAASTR